ncbi:MAG: DUF1826 domain-containing protein [Pseudomonadota bacterium]
MISADGGQVISFEAKSTQRAKHRVPSHGDLPIVLADVYQEDINIAIWERDLNAQLQRSIDEFLASNPHFECAMTVAADSAHASVSEALGKTHLPELGDDIAELIDMFCYLFGLKRVGLRLATLDRAMCPKFHVDRVPCRLITTYQGPATEWLPHHVVNRSKLGPGSNGQPDHKSGLFQHPQDVQTLTCGDVALLKGELWVGNANAGLVHRSPKVPDGENRLLLSLDMSD